MRDNRRSAKKIEIPEEKKKKKDTPWFWLISLAIPWLRIIGAIQIGQWVWDLWKRKKNSDYRTYASVIGNRREVKLKELSAKLGKSMSLVTSDIQAMIHKGYLGPDAYIDRHRNVLVIETMESDYAEEFTDDEEVRKSNFADDVEQFIHTLFVEPQPSGKTKAAEPKPEVKPEPEPEPTVSQESDFEDKLRQIRDLNDEIDDEEVSRRIDRIGELTASIFIVVREKPQQADEVRKFMNYYLPTTLKLLKSYALMEKQSYQGENIQASRKKIEDILDTLIAAFEQQQDRLFRTEALDVEADIEVLETMMAKDGLVTPKGTDLRSVMGGK